MSIKYLSLRAKVLLSSSFIFVFFVILGVISVYSIGTLTKTNRWVDHTHNVIGKADQIVASVVNMETGMRGYLLAGKEEFLEPYNAGNETFHSLIAELQNTVSDNPPQVALLGDVEKIIEDWHANVTKPMIQLRKDIGDSKSMNHMASLIQEEKGKQYFDSFRKKVKIFEERAGEILGEEFSGGKSLLIAAINMETGVRGFLLAGKDSFLEPYNAGKSDFYAKVKELKSLVSKFPAQVQLLNEIESTLTEWDEKVVSEAVNLRREIGLAKTMDHMANLVAQAKGKQYVDKFRSEIKVFIDKESYLMGVRQEAAKNTVRNSYASLALCFFVALIASIFISVFLSRTVLDFSKIVDEITKSTSHFHMTSRQMNNVSKTLSENVNHQAASVEETSTSMEEISGIVQNNVKLAEESQALSEDVQQKMLELEGAMAKISASNQQIESLVKIIDEIGAKTAIINEIVFQTKLLSFNASVEAERAGEHGRGFAVVAQEVGSLAQMSGKAATEISAIVKESTDKAASIAKENGHRVDLGERITKEAGGKAEVGMKGAKQILGASHEQEKGISQIREAIESINKLTQRTSQVSKQASSSSNKLNVQANGLNTHVAKLNQHLKGGGAREGSSHQSEIQDSHLRLVHDEENMSGEGHYLPDEMSYSDQNAHEPLKKVVGGGFGATPDEDDKGWSKL